MDFYVDFDNLRTLEAEQQAPNCKGVDIEEETRRTWMDKMPLTSVKEQNEGNNRDIVLKQLSKMMEVCKAQGFVYGIITENGKPVSGASENLRAWWKEGVRFDENAIAVINNHQAENSNDDGIQGEQTIVGNQNHADGGLVYSLNSSILVPKIKQPFDGLEGQKLKQQAVIIQEQTYPSNYSPSFDNDFCVGFQDGQSRISHQMNYDPYHEMINEPFQHLSDPSEGNPGGSTLYMGKTNIEKEPIYTMPHQPNIATSGTQP
ncbi:hypothetical protein Ccrd_018637 [Cynara cardunculus var. scolymus]|uniref:Ethylene insensitive 3-like DNA-binding domain-containing protein n=1 Tax=Cynara cardunculus var. scolymus TaxID=59895 RepID=A0A103Y5T2_CYNCS|nr:hypothetical protein Ccrd_018637 [Cynara cardunculus var. scolymus]